MKLSKITYGFKKTVSVMLALAMIFASVPVFAEFSEVLPARGSHDGGVLLKSIDF